MREYETRNMKTFIFFTISLIINFIILKFIISFFYSSHKEFIIKGGEGYKYIFHKVSSYYLAIFLLLNLIKHAFNIIFSFCNNIKSPILKNKYKSITLLLPAYKEEDTIVKTLKIITNFKYKGYFQVILLVNGDKKEDREGTLKKARDYLKGRKLNFPIKIEEIKRGGKANALNEGINKVINKDGVEYTDLILTMDSDLTKISGNVLEELEYLFEDPKVNAAAGRILINNAKNFISASQQVEYIIGSVFKRCQDYFNTILVCPGPLSIFKTSVLKRICEKLNRKEGDKYCPFLENILAEDTEITLQLVLFGGFIKYNPKCSVTTDPAILNNIPNLNALFRQRIRWGRGTIKSYKIAWKYLDFSKSIRIWFWILYGTFETFIFPILNFLCLIIITNYIYLFPLNKLFLLYFFLFIFMDIFTILYCLSLENQNLKLVLSYFYIRVIYTPFLLSLRIFSILCEIIGIKDISWTGRQENKVKVEEEILKVVK